MDASTGLDREEALKIQLEILRREHRDLDDAIGALDAAPVRDQLTVRRLKKQKLALKDKISRIEDELFPDIIA